MTAVLIASKEKGSSGWIPLQDYHSTVVVSGANEGDEILLHFQDAEGKHLETIGCSTDRVVPIKSVHGAAMIMAEHIKTSGSRVFVDLLFSEDSWE